MVTGIGMQFNAVAFLNVLMPKRDTFSRKVRDYNQTKVQYAVILQYSPSILMTLIGRQDMYVFVVAHAPRDIAFFKCAWI